MQRPPRTTGGRRVDLHTHTTYSDGAPSSDPVPLRTFIVAVLPSNDAWAVMLLNW